jgi:luciferase family oxidoreductase group 1
MPLLLSVLDQAPTRRGGPPGHAFADSQTLARHVDALGFHRFWVAEHHGIGGVAISAPEVLLATLASQTERIRVGSGGILLPNHRPIHVAEQFRSLEALHPGRIDLGIGRSEGALDDAIVAAFARPADNAHGAGFEDQLAELLAFGGVRPLPDDHPLASARAVPADVPLPPVTLLGSSENSASTAARLGLQYAFAAQTNPDAAAPALQRYRREFVPSRPGDEPYAILASHVMVGEDAEHAAALVAPSRLSLVQARLGRSEGLYSVEDALSHAWTEEERAVAEKFGDRRADIIGDAEFVRDGIERAVEASGADEFITLSNTYEPTDRRASYDRLAAVFDLAAA